MEEGVTGRLTSLSRSLAGKRVIVTGAASGMGRATAYLFADEGARVVVADMNADGVHRVVDEIREVHGEASAAGISVDITEDESRRALLRLCVDKFEGLDILVNNAGVSMFSSMLGDHMDDQQFMLAWTRTLEVNLSSYAHMIRLCVPELRKCPTGGRVVNIASTEGLVSTPGLAAYTASKHAVIGLTKACATEFGRLNVTVNTVCPGPVRTGMTEIIPEESKVKYARRKVPVGRYGEPEEVAHVTVSTCLPACTFLNGATIVVDGGMSISHTL